MYLDELKEGLNTYIDLANDADTMMLLDTISDIIELDPREYQQSEKNKMKEKVAKVGTETEWVTLVEGTI